jgi:hypothetical protein
MVTGSPLNAKGEFPMLNSRRQEKIDRLVVRAFIVVPAAMQIFMAAALIKG